MIKCANTIKVFLPKEKVIEEISVETKKPLQQSSDLSKSFSESFKVMTAEEMKKGGSVNAPNIQGNP